MAADSSSKVFLITGASSGIGAGIAIYLSKTSTARLALNGLKENRLKRIADYCEKFKAVKPLSIVADITVDSEVEKVVNQTVEHFGKIDVLINCSGILSMGGIKETELETYDTIMNTNMRSVFHLTKLATPHLIKTKGSIINISCVAGCKPSTKTLAYSISKAALNHFTQCVALELAPDGVRVNTIVPGFVKSNLHSDIGLTTDQLDLYVRHLTDNIPLKRSPESSEIGAMVAFLTSEGGKSITGCSYAIDGGTMLR